MFGATPIGRPRCMQASYRHRKTGTRSSVFGGGASSMSVPASGRKTQTVGTAPTEVIQSMAAIDDEGGSSPAMISPFDTQGSEPRLGVRDRRAQYSTASR